MKKAFILLFVAMISSSVFGQSFTPNYLKYNSTGTSNRIKPDFIDYDGDGLLDVLGGFESRIDMLHFKNEGSTFSIHSVADSVLGYPIVETLDFNNDGFMDFVAVINNNSANEDIYLYINDGNYNYTSHLMFQSQGDEVGKIELADIDGDGDFDAVVDFNANVNAFVYIENNGNYAFNWSYIMFTGQPADLYGVSDLDGDGLVDIVGSHYNFSTNKFDLLAIETDTVGSTNFIYHNIASYTYTRGGVIADFVGTTFPDIIVSPPSSSGTCELWRNNGSFSFTLVSQPSIQTTGAPFLPKDYDSDGDIDFLSSGGNIGIQLVKNLGNGNFSTSTLIPDQGNQPIDWVDFNGDGFEDLLISGNREVSMFTQDANGNYTRFWGNNDNGRIFLNLLDVDNNNQLDIFTTDFYYLSVIKQTFDEKLLGTEYYNPGLASILYQIRGLIPLDKDSDGDMDFLISFDNGMYWLINTNGTFSTQSISISVTQGSDFQMTDFDSDGNPDIVILENNMKRLEWNGSSFAVSTISNSLADYTLADIDIDGDIDPVFLDYDITSGTYNLKYAKYTSNSFSTQNIMSLSGIIGTNFNNDEKVISNADLDGDGDDDLILMNYGQGKVVWLRNDSNLVLTPFTLTDTIQAPHRIETGDMDNDGDMDIVISCHNTGKVFLFSNNGNQTFTETQITDKGKLIFDMKISDFDQDGDIDVVTNSPVDNILLWLKNDAIDCPRSYSQIETTLCYGDSVLIGGTYFTAPSLTYDTLVSSSGCDSVLIIDVSSFPIVNPSVSNVTICPNDSILFSGNFYSTPGQYFDTLQNINGCDSISQLNLSNYSVPVSTIITDTNRLFTTTTFASYQWYFNGNLLSGESNFEIDAGQYGDGQYFLLGVTNDGCVVSSDTVDFIKVLVGINTIYSNSSITIFPNPAKDVVTITPNFNVNEIKHIIIYSSNGQVLSTDSYTLNTGLNSFQIHFKNVATTTLILEVSTEQFRIRKKLLIQ